MFELAAYHKLNPSGKITIAPVFVEAIVCLLLVYMHVASWLFVALRISSTGGTSWIWVVLACTAGSSFPLGHALRHICMYKQIMLSDLRNFDFQTVACANESDRVMIREAIVCWYGSVEAFSEFVRGPFCKVVHDSVKTPGGMPFGYALMLATPIFNTAVDSWLSLLLTNAPAETVSREFLQSLLAVAPR